MSEELVVQSVLPVGQLSLFELAEVANREHGLAWVAGQSMIEHAIRAGEALTEAKRQVRHGEWLPWLDENFDGSEDTAERYMLVARNSARVRNLMQDSPGPSLRKALAAISDDPDDIKLGGLKESVHVHWYTPGEYVEAARQVMGGIDLDPASSGMANETVLADTYFDEERNGLAREWFGRVWLNPPYGQGSGQFTRKLVEEHAAGRVTAAVLLLNAYGFDSTWFQPLWDWPICFTNHRVKFLSPDRETGGPANANIFVYLGPDRIAFAQVFRTFGAVVERIA